MCKGFQDDFEVANVMEYATINIAKMLLEGDTPDDRAKKIYDKIKGDIEVEYTKDDGSEHQEKLEKALKGLAGNVSIAEIAAHEAITDDTQKTSEDYKDMQKKIKETPKYTVEGVLMPKNTEMYVSIRYNDADRSRLIKISAKEKPSQDPEKFEKSDERSRWIKSFGLKWKINTESDLKDEARALIDYIKKTNRYESDVKHAAEKLKNKFDKLHKEKENKDTDSDRKKQIDLELKGLSKDFKSIITPCINYRQFVANTLAAALRANVGAEEKSEGEKTNTGGEKQTNNEQQNNS